MKFPLLHPGPRQLERTTTNDSWKRFEIRPLTTLIGAEVTGIDLSRPLDDELCAELRSALLEWKVLFFRGQHMTAEQHLSVVRAWGEPEANPFFPTGDAPTISRLEKNAQVAGMENAWHSDHSFLAKPARGAVLRALEVPDGAGDTMWADMAAAYDNLPDEVKDLIDGLEAEHDWITTWGTVIPPEKVAALRPMLPTVVHPVVKAHPETGRKTLYVNESFTIRIQGLPEDEADALFAYLRGQARVPEYQVRFRWEPGSVAIWDNWAVQHYAINDYYPRARVMERVAISGEGWSAIA
jgi:taurine dioxygenase